LSKVDLDVVRTTLSLVDARTLVVAAGLVIASVAIHRPLGRRTHRRPLRVVAALLGGTGVVVLTLANRGVVVSDESIARQLTWWARRWTEVPTAPGHLGWWLNVVLFIPVAVFARLLPSRPRTVIAAAFVASIAIETAHATVLSGIGDPADLIANVAGAVVGVDIAHRVQTATHPRGDVLGER
jgi:hypothetical protein